MHNRRFVAVTLLAATLVPVLAATAYPPFRRLAPIAYGLVCRADLCAEDKVSLSQAEPLYAEARAFIESKVAPLSEPRQVIFCSSDTCAQYFGLSGRRVGQTTGPLGSVIGPTGWTPYIVRHELIHQLQNQTLGTYRIFTGPDWFLEGMAYAWSDDPRQELREPWQTYRHKFIAWSSSVPRQELWASAKALR